MHLGEDRSSDSGAVRIHNDVVGTIAAIAAKEVDGISGMGGGFSMSELFGRKTLNKGVKVEIAQGEAALDLFVIIDYGRNIPEIANQVQQNVKRKVELMTGLSVVEVNVIVEGVQINPERTKSESASPSREYEFENYR